MEGYIEGLRSKAFIAKVMYKSGKISRDEAKELISPYLEEVNRIGGEKSDKYHLKYRPVSFSYYLRCSY